jgi:hypothetical protein
MADPQRRSTRRQKIEPLNYAEAALSPALKGMTSFLDVSPENVRNGTFQEFGPAGRKQGAAIPTERPDGSTSSLSSTGSKSSPANERVAGYVKPLEYKTYPTHESYPGDETYSGNDRRRAPAAGAQVTSIAARSSWRTNPILPAPPESLPESQILSSLNALADDLASGNETTPGDETLPTHSNSSTLLIYQQFALRNAAGADATVEQSTISRAIHPPVDLMEPAPISQRYLPAQAYPEDETYPGRESTPATLTPGRGRSKIKRCVLAQDGHSLGEEAIYQVLWRTGRMENGDPNSSRTNRLGAAEIGYKVNMAKKNVRQNIARLFEKLALEIIEDFGTMNSKARLYRVFSYKQILERRRAVGMEYVLRNKGVVFCNPNGTEVVSSPAYVVFPGDETSLRPAPPKRRKATTAPLSGSFLEIPTPARGPAGRGQGSAAENEAGDLEIVSQALNRYWTVDEPAAVQLIRSCRRVREDARAEEIAFFVREKTELARQNRSITNPTGLILATVPQSFVGSTFDEFRGRMERQAALALEEKERKGREEAETFAWLAAERDRYESIVNDSTKPEAERDAAEKKLRQMAGWNP